MEQEPNPNLETVPTKPDRQGREYTPEEAKGIEKIVGQKIESLLESLRLAQQLGLQDRAEKIEDEISHTYEEAEISLNPEKWKEPLGYLFDQVTSGTSEGMIDVGDLKTKANLINFWRFLEIKFGKNNRSIIVNAEDLVAAGMKEEEAKLIYQKDLILMPGTDYIFFIGYDKVAIGLTQHRLLAEVIRGIFRKDKDR